jgi:uncharacterized protein
MLEHIIQRWSRFVIQQRAIVLILSLLLILISIYPMKDLYFDNSAELFFVEGDPNLINFDHMIDRFGDNDYMLVGVQARSGDKNVFNGDTLRLIGKVTEFMEDHETVTKVVSLSKYQYIHSEDDTQATDDLIEDMEELDDSQENMDRMEQIMKGEKMALGNIITEDFQHTVVIARTEYIRGKNHHKVKLVRDFNAFLANEHFEDQGFKIRIYGSAPIEELFLRANQSDQKRIYPLMFVILLVFMYFSFRTLSGVFFPLIVIFGSIIFVVGVQGFLGWPFNSINTALPGILIILGVGDSVHILVEFYYFRAHGLEPKSAAEKTIQSLWRPCFFTSFTTAIGFIALSVTKLVPIKELGVLGALGALTAFLLSVTTLPALLTFTKQLPEKTKKSVGQGWVVQLTQLLPSFLFRHKKVIASFGILVSLLSVILVSQLSVDSNFTHYFKESNPILQDFRYFNAAYKGADNMDFMIDSGKEGGVKEPEFLKSMLKFQNYLEGLEGSGAANSMVNYVRKMNQSMHNDDPSFYTIPKTRELIAQYLLLYEFSGPEEDLTDIRSAEGRYARISLKFQNVSANQTNQTLEAIKEKLKSDFPELKTEIAGSLAMFNAQDSYIREGIIQSFGLALFIIGLSFFILFRSFKYGIFSLIPSIVPILFAGGIMALLQIRLDMGTMIIGAMTMGIAVDDTIHFMSGYIQNRKNDKSVETSVSLTISEAGRALIFTSIILIGGFCVLSLGELIPVIYIGLFSSIIMIMALLGDLVILPAILYIMDKD